MLVAALLALGLYFMVLQPRRSRTDVNIDVNVPDAVTPDAGSGKGTNSGQ
ncbi:MAG: hypothetical protein ACRENP_23665 [Longimicrobiales bacterium]